MEATELSAAAEDLAPGEPPPAWDATAELDTETMRLEGVAVLSLALREAAEELRAAEALAPVVVALPEDAEAEEPMARTVLWPASELEPAADVDVADAEADAEPAATEEDVAVDDAAEDEDDEEDVVALQVKSYRGVLEPVVRPKLGEAPASLRVYHQVLYLPKRRSQPT